MSRQWQHQTPGPADGRRPASLCRAFDTRLLCSDRAVRVAASIHRLTQLHHLHANRTHPPTQSPRQCPASFTRPLTSFALPPPPAHSSAARTPGGRHLPPARALRLALPCGFRAPPPFPSPFPFPLPPSLPHPFSRHHPTFVTVCAAPAAPPLPVPTFPGAADRSRIMTVTAPHHHAWLPPPGHPSTHVCSPSAMRVLRVCLPAHCPSIRPAPFAHAKWLTRPLLSSLASSCIAGAFATAAPPIRTLPCTAAAVARPPSLPSLPRRSTCPHTTAVSRSCLPACVHSPNTPLRRAALESPPPASPSWSSCEFGFKSFVWRESCQRSAKACRPPSPSRPHFSPATITAYCSHRATCTAEGGRQGCGIPPA